jgi:hypothetical protein
MYALIRYTAATLMHSQRYLAPVLLFAGAVGIFSSNDDGPLPPVYSSCAAMLFVAATWFTIALVSVEEPTHRAITIVSAGGARRVLVATIAVAVLGSLAMSVIGLVLPLVFGNHPLSATDLVVGLVAQLTAAVTGIAIGLVSSRLVIRRQGYALVLALALVFPVLLTPGLAPVNSMLMLMGRVTVSGDLLVPLAGLFAVAVAVLAVAGTATHVVSTRRD